MEYNTFANFTQLFLGEYHIDNCAHDLHHLVVAIDVQMALVALTLCYHTYHPYYAQHVVSMGMGNEQMMDVRNWETYFAQLGENAVAATCINKQPGGGGREHKTSIVDMGNCGAARAEHRYLIHCKWLSLLLPLLCSQICDKPHLYYSEESDG